jgi:hypothetical protein
MERILMVLQYHKERHLSEIDELSLLPTSVPSVGRDPRPKQQGQTNRTSTTNIMINRRSWRRWTFKAALWASTGSRCKIVRWLLLVPAEASDVMTAYSGVRS